MRGRERIDLLVVYSLNAAMATVKASQSQELDSIQVSHVVSGIQVLELPLLLLRVCVSKSCN